MIENTINKSLLWLTLNSGKPQKHRIVEADRNLSRSSSLTACSNSLYYWLCRTISSWVLNISTDGDPTTSLDNLCLCLTIITVKNKQTNNNKSVFLHSDEIFCFLICAHCLLSCQWAPMRRL